MKDCACQEPHVRKRIVLTGGPGAGKTAVLELIRQSLCKHLHIVPESAGILFGGGFPRGALIGERQAAQRAIYFVQRELEACAESSDVAIALCDRGTVDGAAYWPELGSLWTSVGTTIDAELRRYDAVVHLRTPHLQLGYNHANPLRIEHADEAMAIDDRIAVAWSAHSRRFTVDSSAEFIDKASRAIAILREQMPDCCRRHIEAPQKQPG